jgi:hypothetical protein
MRLLEPASTKIRLKGEIATTDGMNDIIHIDVGDKELRLFGLLCICHRVVAFGVSRLALSLKDDFKSESPSGRGERRRN